jgi:hypothetical protein
MKNDKVEFVVRLPKPLHTKARKKSKRLGIPLSVVLRVKLQEWVGEEAKTG